MIVACGSLEPQRGRHARAGSPDYDDGDVPAQNVSIASQESHRVKQIIQGGRGEVETPYGWSA
jgi:hypothetical protein